MVAFTCWTHQQLEEPPPEEPSLGEPPPEEPSLEEPTLEEPTLEEPTIEELQAGTDKVAIGFLTHKLLLVLVL